MNILRIAVVGGGISGIGAAYGLYKNGFNVKLFESSNVLGGRVAPRKLGKRDIAIGGKNVGKKYIEFRQLAEELGVGTFEYFGLNTSRVYNGKISTFDENSKLKGYLGFLQQASIRDILRLTPMIRAVKKHRSNGDLGGLYFKRFASNENNVSAQEYFSEALVDNFIRTMVIRMNGAEPDSIPIANLGSNLQVVLDSYEQLSNGFTPLLNKVIETIPTHLSEEVVALNVVNNNVVGIKINKNGEIYDEEFDHVFIATPANTAAKLTKSFSKRLHDILSTIRYNPIATVVAKYERPVFDTKRRALVFSKDHHLSNAGAYGINDLNIVRYTFSGYKAQSLINNKTSIKNFLQIATEELDSYITIRDNICIDYVGEILSTGLCSYSYYHHDFINNLNNCISNIKGLHLTGDYIYGASLENCLRSSKFAVKNFLDSYVNGTSAVKSTR